MSDTLTIPSDYRSDPAFQTLPWIAQHILDGFAETERLIRAEIARDFETEKDLRSYLQCGLTVRNIAAPAWLDRLELHIDLPVPGTIKLWLDSIGPRVAPGWVSYDIVGWLPDPTPEERQQQVALRGAVYAIGGGAD